MHDGDLGFDYVGFDYSVAFDLHLYYRVFRDIVDWGIAQGYARFYSGSLNYDPKWHLRQSLYPIDLYVRHTSECDQRRVPPHFAADGADAGRSDPAEFSQLSRSVGVSAQGLASPPKCA